MKYSYKSILPHSFKTVLLRHLPKLILVIILTLLVKTNSANYNLNLKNWDTFFVVFIPLLSFLFFLNEDFIEEIILDTSNKKVEIIYYNIYQKQMKKIWNFEEFSSKIKTSFKKQVLKIDFYRDNYLGFTLQKQKDNFPQESLTEIKDILYELKLIQNS